ncbi:MAG: hypothetical protein GYB65_10085 [Chloroflexi bacterium]|nr:hypothetical protein [Chloroflexota bacterium]
MTIYEEMDASTPTGSIAGVRFYEIGKLYHFSCEHLPELRVGDYVIVETTRGRQLGQVMNMLDPDEDGEGREYKPILRLATPTDMMSQKLWKSREVEALISCREKAAATGGFENVKFVEAQYNFDGTLLAILFSAEEKVNTSRLRSRLQRSYKAKVELRQIGPRDVAKVLGGMGACGITRCCSTFLTDFSPISIKMAKAQGVSLNPSEITGMCGRLRCCLLYEYEQYVEARKHLPKRNKRIGTPHGEGRVIDVLPLSDAVVVIVDDTRHTVMREDIIPLEEWEALKAKAESGCSKHGGEACDCGARQPEAETSTDEPSAEEKPRQPDGKKVIKGKSGKSGRSRQRRGRRRGGKRRGSKKPNPSQGGQKDSDG